MKKLIVAISILLLSLPVHAHALKKAAGPHKRPAYAEGEVLVRYKSSVPVWAQGRASADIGARKIKDVGRTKIERIRLPAGMTIEEGLKRLKADPDVEYAEPNFYLYAEKTPNDPLFGDLWGLDNTGQTINGLKGTAGADISATDAWDTQTGSRGVIVAMIDTGVDHDHPDLAQNIWHNPGEICPNGIDDDANGYIDDCIGWDFLHGDNDPHDDHPESHGTHVTGILGARGDNAIGVTGVSWDLSIMALKFLDTDDSGLTSDAIEAIVYARNKGATIVNCSWGGTGASQFLKDAIEDSPGMLFVCAAGNTGDDTDVTTHTPSGFDSANIVAVTASDQDDGLPGFSNYGLVSVDLAAPGTNILSTISGIRATLFSDRFDDGDITSPDAWTSDGSWTVTGSFFNTPSFSITESPSGSYAQSAVSIINSPDINIPAYASECAAYYTLRLDTEAGADVLRVEASASPVSGPWTTVATHSGSTNGQFLPYVAPLDSLGNNVTIQLRFNFTADGDAVVGDGAYIDDVRVLCLALPVQYDFISGTSMSTPYVSGIAALLKADKPSLSALEIKHLIITSVDQIPSFSGLMVSGGRANAFRALNTTFTSVPPLPPSSLSATATSTTSVSLSWTDNSANETGFTLERSTGADPFVFLADLPADTSSFIDGTLVPDTLFTYRVRAYNSFGDSPWSNESSARTLAPATESGGGGGGGGCFVATAAYGGPDAPEVKALRRFRDEHLLTNPPGRLLVRLYYACSPPAAKFISRHGGLRLAARTALWPLVMGAQRPGAAGLVLVSITLCSAALLYRSRQRGGQKTPKERRQSERS